MNTPKRNTRQRNPETITERRASKEKANLTLCFCVENFNFRKLIITEFK